MALIRCLVVVACASRAVEAAPDVVVKDWLAARGASQAMLDKYDYDGDSCPEIAVGPQHEPALQCYMHDDVSRPIPGSDEPAYRILDHEIVLTVRDHEVVTLIDVPVKAEVLDAPGPLLGNRKPWHPFEVAPDGKSIVVGDPAEAADCRATVSHPNPPADDSERVWAALDRDLRDRICKARGTYVWRRGRFQRKA